MLLQPLIFAAVLPALVAAAAVALLGRAGGALALGGAYAAAHAGLLGWPPWPIADTMGWLPYVAIAAAALGAVETCWPPRAPALRVFDRLAVAGVALALLLGPLLGGREAAGGAIWLVAFGGGALAVAAALDALPAKLPGWRLPAVLGATAGSGAAVLLATGSAVLAGLCGSLAAAAGGALAASLVRPAAAAAALPSCAAPFAILLAGLLAYGHVFSFTPAVPLALTGLAPLLGLTGRFWAPLAPLAVALGWIGPDLMELVRLG